ncbi:MAG: OmpH family outer membrane protein [Thermodesulfovibrionales bacterium]
MAISIASFSCSTRSVKVDNPVKIEDTAVVETAPETRGAAKVEDAAKTMPDRAIKDTAKKVDISVKMGVIDLQKVAEESLAGKKSTVEYNILAKAKQASIEEKNKAIEKLRSELEQQKQDISEKALKQKLEELEKLETELSRFGQDAEAELGRKYEELYSNMLREVLELTGKIGAAENYTVIIDKGVILYCDKNLDITDPFTKEYDELKEADKLKPGTQPEK